MARVVLRKTLEGLMPWLQRAGQVTWRSSAGRAFRIGMLKSEPKRASAEIGLWTSVLAVSIQILTHLFKLLLAVPRLLVLDTRRGLNQDNLVIRSNDHNITPAHIALIQFQAHGGVDIARDGKIYLTSCWRSLRRFLITHGNRVTAERRPDFFLPSVQAIFSGEHCDGKDFSLSTIQTETKFIPLVWHSEFTEILFNNSLSLSVYPTSPSRVRATRTVNQTRGHAAQPNTTHVLASNLRVPEMPEHRPVTTYGRAASVIFSLSLSSPHVHFSATYFPPIPQAQSLKKSAATRRAGPPHRHDTSPLPTGVCKTRFGAFLRGQTSYPSPLRGVFTGPRLDDKRVMRRTRSKSRQINSKGTRLETIAGGLEPYLRGVEDMGHQPRVTGLSRSLFRDLGRIKFKFRLNLRDFEVRAHSLGYKARAPRLRAGYLADAGGRPRTT
ncbi:hypothetical protein C8R43DRAFT_942575 [Mycena crocata]|nr:hypothetical protein C8R43DRAFT_942575 [Mycena crocata]